MLSRNNHACGASMNKPVLGTETKQDHYSRSASEIRMRSRHYRATPLWYWLWSWWGRPSLCGDLVLTCGSPLNWSVYSTIATNYGPS